MEVKKLYEVVKKIPKFKKKYPVVIDLESEGLYVNVVTVQMYQPQYSEKVQIMIIEDDKQLEQFQKLNDYELIAHRGIFDYAFLRLKPKVAHDTKFLVRIAYPQWNNLSLRGIKPYSLEHATDKLIGKNEYKKYGIDKNTIRSKFKRGQELTVEELTYGALDCIHTYKIWKQLSDYHKEPVYKLNCKVLKTNVQIPYNYLYAHKKSVNKELENLVADIENNKKILNGVNPNSWQQVLKALGKPTGRYKTVRVQATVDKVKQWVDKEYLIYKYKKYEFIKSDKPVLLDLIAMDNPIAKAVFDQRRLLKAKTTLETYNTKPVDKDFTECISFIDPMGAYTGRMSASGGDLENGINCQQIPRKYQYLFTFNRNDTTVVHADYSTAELRAGASIMEVPKMAQLLREGVDLHNYIASQVKGVPIDQVTKDDRSFGKVLNFGLLFGMGVDTFREYAFIGYGVSLSKKEAQKAIDKYFAVYPELKKYHNNMWNTVNRKEIIFTPLGLPSQPKMGTDAINFAVQGSIGDATKIALVRLVDKYPESINYIVNIIHDAIELRVPKSEAKKWAKRVAKVMKYGWSKLEENKMFKIKGIPMPVEVEFNGKVKLF